MTAAAQTRSPLSIPEYRLFWFSRFSAVMATTAMIVVIGWQVYEVARSEYGMSPANASGLIGLLGLVQFLPLLVLTPVAGWAADRFERRTVARLATAIDVGVAVLLGWITMANLLSLPLIFSLAAAHGAARVFVGPAMSSMVANIVPPDVLPKAIAMNSIAWQSASVIGPAVGGWLYAAQPSAPYWLAAVLLSLAIVALSMIRPIKAKSLGSGVHPVRQMVEGLRYTWNERFLLGAITLDLFAVLLGGATALLPAFARDVLGGDAATLGWLRAAPAAGAASVALYLSFVPLRQNVGVKMLWAVVVFGLATICFGLSRDFHLSLALLALLGGADMLSVYVRSALVQLNTPDQMRGRVASVSTLAISASNELGEMQSGAAALLLGPVEAVVFGGIGAILITALWARLFPELRNARTFEPQFRDTTT